MKITEYKKELKKRINPEYVSKLGMIKASKEIALKYYLGDISTDDFENELCIQLINLRDKGQFIWD